MKELPLTATKQMVATLNDAKQPILIFLILTKAVIPTELPAPTCPKQPLDTIGFSTHYLGSVRL